MQHTLKETFDNEIDSYRPFRQNETGFYLIIFDNPDTDREIEITAWGSQFDDYPEDIEKKDWKKLPRDGWLHCDDCTCEECESEEASA